jgi:integrase/recombinase XerD
MKEKQLAAKSVVQKMAAMKFFYVHVLKRTYRWEELPYPKIVKRLPIIISKEEIGKIIDTAIDLYQRSILMTLYPTGMRCAELANLKVSDIDSKRMMIRIHCGKGGKDRDVPLSPMLLETLRKYWRWMKPQTYLFPSRFKAGSESHITTKGVFCICQSTARKAGITKAVGCHNLTVLQPIFSKQAWICEPFSFCSAMPALAAQSFIYIYHGAIYMLVLIR